MNNTEKTMDKIVALCKNRGFIFPGSEIYGGLANSWDYGPLGVEFKNNVKKAWWKKFVQECRYNVGLDSAIIMNPQTWVASGHVGGFSDPLMDCKSCKTRHRADKLIEEYAFENGLEDNPAGWTFQQMADYMEYTMIRNQNRGVDLETLLNQKSELADNSYARMVQEKGEEGAEAVLRGCVASINENGEIIRSFSATGNNAA